MTRKLLKNQKHDCFVLLYVPVHSQLCVNAFSVVPSLFVFALLCHVLSPLEWVFLKKGEKRGGCHARDVALLLDGCAMPYI
jgi:hypothetical protein